jgi:hypothetical protein
MTQVKLQGIRPHHECVAWSIHDGWEIAWKPEEKVSFRTYNPSLLGWNKIRDIQ